MVGVKGQLKRKLYIWYEGMCRGLFTWTGEDCFTFRANETDPSTVHSLSSAGLRPENETKIPENKSSMTLHPDPLHCF